MIDFTLIQYMKEQMGLVSLEFKRYNYDEIEWNLRLVCLCGPRGVGKSTLVLQHLLLTPDEKSLYVSADHSYFTTHTLIQLADDFVKDGGEHLYIDEVHKYGGWSSEIKQIYDTHPGLKTFVTGSSILDLLKGEVDLSRRMVVTYMYGMSFREYMSLIHNVDVPIFKLEEVLSGKANLGEVKHPLPYFRQYLKDGYYPFSKEGAFYTRLEQVIRQTLEVDIPQHANMTPATGRKLRQMLNIIAQNAPYKPEISGLAAKVHASRNDVPDYLLYMERAGMIGQLRDDTGGMRGLGKVEKLYLDNTNLQYALVGEKVEIGNVRETFFYSQTHVRHDVVSSRESDFRIDEYIFEVGGKKKGKKQIEDVKNGYVVRDEIEYAAGNIVPLWAFGLLY